MNCNPNTIELLGCKPEHYFCMTDIGQQMIENRHLFLSQRAAISFGGYATQQLRRMENALAHDVLPQGRKEEHIRQSMESAVTAFQKTYSDFDQDSIKLYTDISEKDGFDREIFADITLKHFPAREFNSMLNNMINVIGTYDKLTNRNKKKDALHLNKHAMHLIRLYLMGLDILEKEEICTYRENERDFLLEIRNGKYMQEDGTYCNEFFDIVNELEKRLKYAKKNTSLPKTPNRKKIEEFVMSVNRRAIDT
jgi:predicted nucleotidyltransferase